MASHSIILRITVLLALVYTCGVFTGIATGAHRRSPSRVLSGLEAAHERYFRRFVDDFRLDAKQQRDLWLVLEERARKQKDWWNDRILRDDPRDRESLVRLDRTSESLIRLILKPDQRARYDARLARIGEAVDGPVSK